MAFSSIIVRHGPTKWIYIQGETLDLTGMVVGIEDDLGDVVDVAFEDFAANDITTSPVHGAVLLDSALKNISVYYDAGGLDEYLTATPIAVQEIGVKILNPPLAIRLGGRYVRWREGQVFHLKTAVLFAGEFDDTVTWSSANDTIASVDEYGRLKAVGAGTVAITATSNEDPAYSDDFLVEVVDFEGDYISGAMVHKLIKSMDGSVLERFEEEQVRRMIEVPDDTDNLHTAQLALVCSVI